MPGVDLLDVVQKYDDWPDWSVAGYYTTELLLLAFGNRLLEGLGGVLFRFRFRLLILFFSAFLIALLALLGH